MQATDSPPATLRSLWAQFLPLSLSDITMAAGDPLLTTTLAHMPDARGNLAAVGVAKSLAVFFESPIIMMLHASNALAASAPSSRALWRFMLLACAALTAGLAVFTLPGVFAWMAAHVLGLDAALAERSRHVLTLMVLWPAAIGWRRYFQGLLIRGGHGRAVGQAGVARLVFLAAALGLGLAFGLPGLLLAGLALVAGVGVEAAWVTIAALRLGATRLSELAERPAEPALPVDMGGVWRFYWPLANSMLVVWGGRALLVAIVARASDAPIALAAWPAAWGLVLLVANATRMVQQVVIRNRERANEALLVRFALSVGGACSALLLALVATPLGAPVVSAFVGSDPALISAMGPVLAVGAAAPLVVAWQNAMQGFLIAEGRTARVNVATWLGTGVLLLSAAVGIGLGLPGALTAAGAMVAALVIEAAVLAAGRAAGAADGLRVGA